MVGVSYHELNANTPRTGRHSAGERKQFLVVCVVGVAVLLNASINAGLLEPVVIKDDVYYPGGSFIHKLVEDKDYAATGGLWRRIRRDLKTDQHVEDDKSFDRDLYAVYIDVDTFLPGTGRFFTGILSTDSDSRQRLLDLNTEISKRDANKGDFAEFDLQEYDIGTLPTAKCAVTTFPFTNGFISALLHNYKVFPALKKHARRLASLSDSKMVISTTCNREKQMCTHYITLEEGEKFLLGHADSKDYAESSQDSISLKSGKVMKGLKKLIGMKDEL